MAGVTWDLADSRPLRGGDLRHAKRDTLLAPPLSTLLCVNVMSDRTNLSLWIPIFHRRLFNSWGWARTHLSRKRVLIYLRCTVGSLKYTAEHKRRLSHGAAIGQGNAAVLELLICFIELVTEAIVLPAQLLEESEEVTTAQVS